MGDQGLRCLDCRGKFGRPVADLRCATCGNLFKVKEFPLSEEYPPEGVVFAEVELRALVHNLKHTAQVLNQQLALGGGGPPETSKGSEAVDKGTALQTTPKSKPAVKGEHSPKAEASGSKGAEAKEESLEEEAVDHVPKEKESKKKRKAREENKRGRSPQSQEPRKRKRKSRTPGRSRSRRRRESREEEKKRNSKSLSPIERRPRVREGETRRSPVRPKSPVGPPPPRSPDRRWEGPIPARQAQRSWDAYPRHPGAENKGRKKRKQQALFNEFKAWRQDQWRQKHS